MYFDGMLTQHEGSSCTPAEPAGLPLIRIMKPEVVTYFTADEVCHSIEILSAPRVLTVPCC